MYFLPRDADAMRKRGLCCGLVSTVRPSVCLSFTFVHSIQTVKILSNFFVALVAPSF